MTNIREIALEFLIYYYYYYLEMCQIAIYTHVSILLSDWGRSSSESNDKGYHLLDKL